MPSHIVADFTLINWKYNHKIQKIKILTKQADWLISGKHFQIQKSYILWAVFYEVYSIII